MPTLAWLMILGAIILVRQVLRGRATELPTDLGQLVVASLDGDTATVKRVLGLRGTDLTATEGAPLDTTTLNAQSGGANTAPGVAPIFSTPGSGLAPWADTGLLAAAMYLGSRAKGYRFGWTGPDFYDCSGLVWRALMQTKLYNGPRFTTFNFGSVKGFAKVTDGKYQVNDVVVWPTHHMGIVAGADQFYSARNPRIGIGTSKISTWGDGTPIFYRWKG